MPQRYRINPHMTARESITYRQHRPGQEAPEETMPNQYEHAFDILLGALTAETLLRIVSDLSGERSPVLRLAYDLAVKHGEANMGEDEFGDAMMAMMARETAARQPVYYTGPDEIPF